MLFNIILAHVGGIAMLWDLGLAKFVLEMFWGVLNVCKTRKVDLDCSCQIVQMPERELDNLSACERARFAEWPEQLDISVFNAGVTPVIIRKIDMRAGFKKIQTPVFQKNPDANAPDYSNEFLEMYGEINAEAFPVTLTSGAITTWSIVVGDEWQWFDYLAQNFVKTKRDLKKFRFVIYANHGRKKRVKPGKDVVNAIAKCMDFLNERHKRS